MNYQNDFDVLEEFIVNGLMPSSYTFDGIFGIQLDIDEDDLFKMFSVDKVGIHFKLADEWYSLYSMRSTEEVELSYTKANNPTRTTKLHINNNSKYKGIYQVIENAWNKSSRCVDKISSYCTCVIKEEKNGI